MKKSILLVLVLLLSGCSWFGSSSELNIPADSIGIYDENTDIYFAYPESWKEVESGIVDNVLFGFFSQNPSIDGYFSNMNIMSEPLSVNVSSAGYSRTAVESLRSRLLSYNQERYELFTYHDNGKIKDTYLHVFTGRDNFKSPEFRFIQTYYVKNNMVYIKTFTLPVEEENYDQYIVLSQFTGFLERDPFLIEDE